MNFVTIHKVQLVCTYKNCPFLGKSAFSLDNYIVSQERWGSIIRKKWEE